MMPANSTGAAFIEQLTQAWQNNSWEQLSLTGRQQQAAGPAKIRLRPVEIGEQLLLQWTFIDDRKQQTHQNRNWDNTIAKLSELVGLLYTSAHLRTNTTETQFRWLKNGELQVKTTLRKTAAAPPSRNHNQARNYLLPEGVPCLFLEACGIMNAVGQVRKTMYHKFRQINRFLEFIENVRDYLPQNRPVCIVDYGCGKSYLSFAVRHLLVDKWGLQVKMLGLDSNPQVIHSCQRTVAQLGWSDIHFQASSLEAAEIAGPIDLAIWLHACDTATDDALIRSCQLAARIILAVPCCQHQLHYQLQSEVFEPWLKHGILRERLAADLTDTLRALWLERQGYHTRVMEFIDLEHTSKNLLIRAIRKNSNDPAEMDTATSQYQLLLEQFQIQQFRLNDT